jgi:thiamine biosynthesis lipoprotein
VRAGLLPSQHADDAVIPAPSSIANLQLHGANYITVMHRVCLDFGGIAKGYAVDKAIEAVTSRGVSRCLINAGGDLRVTGDLAEKIFVRLPASPGTLVCLGCLSDGALATSAPYYSLQGEGAAARCALYAPSGKSLTQSLSYTVLAPECVIADALTKAVAVAFNQNTQARDAIAGRASVFLPYDPGFLIPFDAQAFIL